MLRAFIICFFLIAMTGHAYILDYEIPERETRGDVPSVFFSPFRMVGKRNQFYGLYKQLGNKKGEASFE
uniref:Secreted protein n=1 Tax=Caenorhabditis tropicalis TaxID=1561998 RepID=A0A1I7UJT8_9PELO